MRLLIIDGNAIIHRAYHAIPPLTTQKGLMVNAVYGFTSMLLKVWNDLKPTHIAVTFDMAGPTFRHVKFEKYKATRVKADQELYDQIPLAHDLVRAFGIPIYEKKGYEADDVIGTIVEKVKKQKNIEVLVVTGDMDTLQLIQPAVRVYTLRKGMSDVVIYDAAEVKKRFGFGPEMLVDYKALRGDASDNIPGVPGIGEKTATELIMRIGGVEEIYNRIKNQESCLPADMARIKEIIRPGALRKLEEGEESAKISRELAAIDCAVPDLDFKLDDCAVRDFDREKVIKMFQEFEFASLLKRVPGMEREGHEIPPHRGGRGVLAGGGKKDFSFTEIKNQSEIESLLEKIRKTKQFACRALTSGADVFTSELLGLVFVVGHEGFYVRGDLLEKCWPIFSDKSLELVGHDLKKLVKVICSHPLSVSPSGRGRGTVSSPFQGEAQVGLPPLVQNKLFDVMLASYLLNPGSRAHDPASVVLKILGKELPAGAKQGSLFGVDARAAAQELYFILQTAETLKKELIKTDDLGLLEKMEMPLIPVLAEMELNGVAVDTKMLAKLSGEVAEEIKKVSKKIYKMAGAEFNISSPLQLREVLFEKLDIPTEGIKKGKTGLSTSAEQLEKMRGLHPIIDEIENYRELEKLRNTYIDVLPALINKKTGRIHTTFNQAVTATGRLSSSDPNLQNIPIRTELGREIRRAFIAEEGNVLLSADYSQIELRVVASLAEDKKMMEIFAKDEDIHKATAAIIQGVPLEKVTKEMRRAAKEINFGVLYGMGSYGLSWRAEIPQAQARDFIKKYFEQFSGVKEYIERTLEFTRKEGYCETLFGRRRYLPELNSPNFQLRSAAERMAINHPVQGTAADLIKMAMLAVHDVIARPTQGRPKQSPAPTVIPPTYVGGICGRCDGDIKMLLQVHDELVFEVQKSLADEFGGRIKEIMESVVKLRVPIKVEVHAAKRWGEIK